MSLLDKASLIVTPNAYKSGTLYSVIPSDGSGDMTFSRASTGTRVNSQGLVEVVPYNLFSYTEEFDNAAWTSQGVTLTANATTAPNGTLTADKIILNNGSQADPIVYQLSDTTVSTRTLSFYAKASEYNIAFGRIGGAVNSPIVLFSLTGSGSILHNQNVFSYSIEALENGWYRCSMTYSHGTSFAPNVGVCSATYSVGTSTVTSTGNGTSGIFIWGAQLNEGSLKDYFPISSTRNNFPRLDYSNGSCPSLLLEPQRTNRILYSQDFSNGAWSAIDTTITANTTASPSGNTDADTMTITSSTSRIFQLTSLGADTYTTSIYVKSLSGTPTIQFRMVVDGTDITQSIPTTTEWVRHDFTFTAASSFDYFVIRGESGTGSVAIWGAQLEAGSYASSIIPTTSTSVTRVADSCSKTGISSLIGQTEGVIFYDFELSTTGVDFTLGNLYSSSNGNSFSLIYVNPSNAAGFSISNNGVTQCEIVIPTLSLGRHKIAFAYKANDFAVYVDGIAQGTDTSGTVPAMDNFNLRGFNLAPSSYIQRTNINSAILFKERLSNAELAQLTTI